MPQTKRVFTGKYKVGQTVWYVCEGSLVYGSRGVVLEVDPESYRRQPPRNPYRIKWESFDWPFYEIEANVSATNPNPLYFEMHPLARDVDAPYWRNPDEACPGWRDRPAWPEQKAALTLLHIQYSAEITSGEAEALIAPHRQPYMPQRPVDREEVFGV